MRYIIKKLFKYVLCFFSILVLLTTALVAYLVWFQPPFYFPKPTGKYVVGCKDYYWVDTSRKETLANDPIHPNRELMVKVWYPAQGSLSKKPTAPYAPYLIDYYKTNNKLLWLTALSRPIYCYANFNASIINNKSSFPIVLFSHGWGGTRESNSVHCEELASHGYIVVGISHTYHCGVVKFPDGRTVDLIKASLEMEKKSFMERRKINDQKITNIWLSDVHFVLDQLEKVNRDQKSLFFQRFDLNNIGIFGQSMGGSNAIQACRNDARIKACVNLDGSMFGSDVTKSFDKPFMAIFAGDTINIVNQLLLTQNDWKSFRITSEDEAKLFISRYLRAAQQLAKAIGHDSYVFAINNAGHLDFTNSTFLKSASLFTRLSAKLNLGLYCDFGVGSIDAYKVTEIVNVYLVNFFDKYLKGQPSKLLNAMTKTYPEIDERSIGMENIPNCIK